jgi:3-methyladenine DNA glycosylase/8-oxoguanine DNA glycosylase
VTEHHTGALLSPRVGPPVTSVWAPGRPVDIGRTLWPLRRGSLDPTLRTDGTGFWRTGNTPEGPATIHLSLVDAGAVSCAGWGPGAGWAVDQVPELLGADDDWSGLDSTGHPLLSRTRRTAPGMRVPRTAIVFDVLVPAVLEQRVVGADARRSWQQLVTRFGLPAPGPAPADMRVPPRPEQWAAIASWEWHLAGVDPGRARTVRNAARVAEGLQRTVSRGRGGPEVVTALRTVPGIGLWTAAEIVQRAHGDPDTVSVGDYHLPAVVGWALSGRPVDDDGMLELLQPWVGHRHRVVRLIESSGFRKPRFGPRAPRVDHRRR